MVARAQSYAWWLASIGTLGSSSNSSLVRVVSGKAQSVRRQDEGGQSLVLTPVFHVIILTCSGGQTKIARVQPKSGVVGHKAFRICGEYQDNLLKRRRHGSDCVELCVHHIGVL